jgi:hypothetical protein
VEFADLPTQVQASNSNPSGVAMGKLIAPIVANFAWTLQAGLVDRIFWCEFGVFGKAVEKCVAFGGSLLVSLCC